MKEKTIRICPISKLPLPPTAHGNMKYHPVADDEAKHLNNEKGYGRTRNLVNLAKRLDDILAKHYPHSLSTMAFNKEILDREGFAWDFNSSIILLPDMSPLFWVIDYGYSIANQNCDKIIIHHGNNPIQQPHTPPANSEAGNHE